MLAMEPWELVLSKCKKRDKYKKILKVKINIVIQLNFQKIFSWTSFGLQSRGPVQLWSGKLERCGYL